MSKRFLLLRLPCIGAALLPLVGASGAELSEKDILAGAKARIEQCRKNDVALVVKGSDGKPVANIAIDVQQTRHQFLFGSNIFMLGRLKTPADNAAYERRFAELLNFATLPFYWWAYESVRGAPDHARTDQIASWCRAHGVAMKGHPLLWNYVDPKWLPDDGVEARRLQLDRITDCVTRFRDTIHYWDVVNEATQFDREMCRRQAPKLTAAMSSTGVIDVVRQAFVAARKADPGATLLINDYITDASYADRIVGPLKGTDSKRLYDVIGIQCHQHGGAWPAAKIWEICERFAKFGVPLHFTEATFVSGEQGWDLAEKRKGFEWRSTPQGEARQAADVERFYTVLFSHPSVEAITWWDFSDQGAWQQAPAGLVRKDMSPKPAYDTLLRLVKGDWWTHVKLTTDGDGKAKARGFLGEYRATFKIDGREVSRAFTVSKGDVRVIELKVTE